MSNPYKILVSVTALTVSLLCSCKKEADNIFNMFKDVTLTLHDKHPYSVTGYKQVNDGDSVYFDFTIESKKTDMYMVAVQKAGSGTPFLRIPITDESKRRSYSDIVRLKANEGVGKHSYRIWAYDKEGVYIGDGYKTITIEVAANFTIFPNRKVYFPDSASGSLNSYLSVTTGKTYNYTTGAANAGEIDLGIYRKFASNKFTTHLYSLSANPLPFTVFNISSWTKRATLFSTPISNGANTFNNTLKSSIAIETEAKKRTINQTSITADIVANSLLYFLTPEGKYGAILVNSVTSNLGGTPLIDVTIKIQN